MSSLYPKKILSFCFLFVFILFYESTWAYSNGPPNGYTGQPPEGSTCALSRACHAGEVSDNSGIEISISGNPEVFVSGETYQITVQVNDPIAACFGFQIGAQFEEDRSAAGDFIVSVSAEGYERTNTGNYQYVEHNTPSSSGIWVFDWKAPADKKGSNIIFYAAGIAANCDGEPETDATYTTSKTLPSSCGGILINESVNGYALDAYCDYTELEPRVGLNIESIIGGSGLYTIEPFGNSSSSENTVAENEPFSYFFNQQDVLENTVGFEVRDESGNVCKLNEQTIASISGFVGVCNRPCSAAIELDFQPGDISEFSCDNLMNITVEVNTVSGGTGEYYLSTLGVGTLSEDFVSSQNFTYTFNLEDALDQTIGFLVNDQNGCAEEFDFTNRIPYDELKQLCDEPDCSFEIEISVVGGMDEPEISCDSTNPDNILYSIEIESVSGVVESYDLPLNAGMIITYSDRIEEGFSYVFSQQVVDNEAALFIINNTELCAQEFNFNNYLSSLALEELCLCTVMGCLDEAACNYNPMACIDDGNCLSAPVCNKDCTLGNIEVVDLGNPCNCLVSVQTVLGCMDENASNYNPNATCNDGSCMMNVPVGCTDRCAPNYDPEALADDGSCQTYNTNCNMDCANGDIEVWDNINCSCVVSERCSEECDASAGELRPIQFDTFCTLRARVTMPVQFGYNINYEYVFLITNPNLEIVAQTNDFRTDLTGLPADEYCIYGLSYDAFNAPDLSVNNIQSLLSQSSACFEITQDCVPLTIQADTNSNPFSPNNVSEDTLFLCTGYTIPIDFCVELNDEDGGKAYLVDIISFCNPSIEGDNCVHYPPLPGLLVGDTELISLIYCDDDCPQLCDTSYASISILDPLDCENFMGPDSLSINCFADTVYTCAKPLIPLELCADCSYADTEYFINNIQSTQNATFEVRSGNCINYTANENLNIDSLIVELCSWEIVDCVEKLFIIDYCGETEECPQIFACTPPIVEQRICLECESSKFPNAVITDIKTKFDECVINLVDKMCFDYIPLPLMDILETDTAIITYCDELTGDCYESDVIITYSNCDEGAFQLLAANDYFEGYENENIALPVLENDLNATSSILNIVNEPVNGVALIDENQVIQYFPQENFVGYEHFTYEICNFVECYEAGVFVEVYPDHRTSSQSRQLRTYPNPVNDQLTVEYELDFDKNVWILMYNALGETVFSSKKLTEAGFYKHQLNVAQYNKGIYFIDVTLGYEKQSIKILVD